MPAINPQTLLEEAKCYSCFGPISQPRLLKLALLSRMEINASEGLLLFEDFSGSGAPDNAIILEGNPNFDASTWTLGGGEYLELQELGGAVDLVGFPFAATVTHYGSIIYSGTGISTVPELFWLADVDFGVFAFTLRATADGKLQVLEEGAGPVLGTSIETFVFESTPVWVWWKYTSHESGLGQIEVWASSTSNRPELPCISAAHTVVFSPTVIWFVSGDGVSTNAIDNIHIRKDHLP